MPVDKREPRIQQMFGEIAPRYDRMNHLLSLNVDRYWRWRTVRILNPGDELPILDVCTGTGDMALAFCRRVRGRVPVIGTDFCPEMLEVGEQKRLQAGIGSQLTFLQADTQQLPFAANHFQLVTAAFGLRNVADTQAGLREMVRVCAPGGRVGILEFSVPRRQPMRGLYGLYFRYVLPRIGQLLAANSHDAYRYLPESVREFATGEALIQLLLQAGLNQVEGRALTGGIATLYVGTK